MMAHKIKLPFVGFFFLFLLLVLNPIFTFAAVFNVSTPFELRTALFTSESNGEIDFINIAPGIYNTGGVPFEYTAAFTENFGLTITGSGMANTILSAPNQSAVLIIDADAVLVDFSVNINIEDVSIQGGNSLLFSGLAGGLTILSNTGNVMVDSCNFEDNVGDTGGGAWVDTSGQVSVSDSIFDNNTAINSNGGGALLAGNFILLTNNLFNMNDTSVASFRGGGLRALALATNGGGPANGTIIANGNDFTNNDSAGHGGASLLADFGVELQGNNFIDNTSGVAGAAGVSIDVFNTNPGQGDENLLLTRLFSNLFQDNITSGRGGGALVLAGLDIIAVNNIFLGNIADSAGGAELEAQDITVTNNTMTLNEAVDGEGGGILLVVQSETTADIYNNIAYNNSATVAGSDIFVNDDPDLNVFGATINLVANDFSDFFSLCAKPHLFVTQ